MLATEAVVKAARPDQVTFGFERIDDAALKGLPGPIPLFHVSRADPCSGHGPVTGYQLQRR